MRNFKNLYRSTAEVKCSGCHKQFAPTIFKGHYLKCQKIEHDLNDTGDKMFVKLVDTENSGRTMRFFISSGGV